MGFPKILLDTLLPNRAWNRQVQQSGGYKMAYWGLRIALMVVLILLAVHFGVRQQAELR